MAFQAYLPCGFEHRHENEAFAVLVQKLNNVFGTAPGRHVLLGNVMFSSNEMDAVLLKPDGIAIIEMKDHGGRIQFSENGAWTADGREVRGGTKANPFVQVRGYRIALRTWLEELERQAELHPREFGYWRDISTVVLFARTIQFDDKVLIGGVRYWFHITDLQNVANRVAAIQSRNLRISPEEVDSILDRLGITARDLYSGQPIAPAAQVVAAPQQPSRTQLCYVKEFPFRDHELRMRNLGGARSQGTQQVRQWFEQVRQGLNPFTTIQSRKDTRVQGATIYAANFACELILIELGAIAIPVFLGDPAEVNGWLDTHTGLTVSIDDSTGRVLITRLSGKASDRDLQPPAVTAENQPFLLRVSGLDYETLVPQKLAREHLLGLDETSTEIEIDEALDLVYDSDLRAFLFDVIDLVRSGDLPAAEARIKLRKGEALPVEDAGAFAEQATASIVNSDQVLVINELSKEKLDQLLDPEKFQEWMLFLHPDQQALVEAEFEKPVVLKGVSGSGKTCIVVHRARHLARKYPNERIGVLTLSKPLAKLLQNLVNRLCSEEERESIVVLPFYELFRECLKTLGPTKYFAQLKAQLDDPSSHMHSVLNQAVDKWPHAMVWELDPVSQAQVEEEWEDFYTQSNSDVKDWMRELDKYLIDLNVDASRYLEEEFTLIRSAFAVPDRREKYLAFDRIGRTVPLRSDLRKDLLRLLLFWEEWLLAGGMIDALGLTQALMPLHSEMQKLPENLRFRCLLVDEYQDFSSLDLQLLRRVVPLDKPNALFVAGDPVQKILVKRLRYADAALDEGTATHKKIWKNYRNSKQILRAASKVANHFGKVAGSQGEEIEVLDPELAQRETNPPIALSTSNQIEKAWEIALECMRNDFSQPWTICIATASPQSVSVDKILKQQPKDLKATALSGDCILHPDEVVVGTITDLKGFEFRLVIIVGCDADSLPYSGIPSEEIWREALRLYVAMTRARDQIFLVYEGQPSRFLEVMEDTVIHRDEPSLAGYEKANPSKPITPVTSQSIQKGARIKGHMLSNLEPDGRCEMWFSALEVAELNKYFARHVYRDGLTFREWLRPETLKSINSELFYRIPKCRPTIVSAIIIKLREKGVELRQSEHCSGRPVYNIGKQRFDY